MTWRVDALVIGAGVVDLACARRLAAAGRETVVLEGQRQFGQGISSRNSEVIHAGLDYPVGSLKARLCRQGRDMLYGYCGRRGIAHRRVGKWVVATSQQQAEALQGIAARGRTNGCEDLVLVEGDAARRIEPELRCVAALESLSTGIVDSLGLMTALLADTEAAGGSLAVCSPAAAVPARCFAKGSSFTLSGRSPFQRLIYPVPEVGGLGLHLTLDLQGQAKFGLNMESLEAPEYTVDSGLLDAFHQTITAYWPGCDRNRLQPGYADVRPKLGSRDHFADDFVIKSAETHGVAGLVNLVGIESPKLTSCLAIAEEVAARVGSD